ncbi:MAG TPA: hypothetical protein VF495_05140 [Phenylobacterium sp.]
MATLQLPHWIWPTALMAVCGVTAWRGRDEEKLAAGAILADWALSVFVARSTPVQDTQWGVLLVDTAQFAVLLWIAMRSTRFWPLTVSAFALLQLVTHLAHAADPTVTGWSYFTAELIWSYLLLLTVGYGAWTAPYHWARPPWAAEEPGPAE